MRWWARQGLYDILSSGGGNLVCGAQNAQYTKYDIYHHLLFGIMSCYIYLLHILYLTNKC